MQNKKKLSLVICLVALLVMGALCLSACTKKDSRSIVTFEGVEEIHAPVGTVTEESLLAGVTATDANGKKQDVTVDLGGADLSKPGRYLIEYKVGDNVKREAVYLYGDISFQINGQDMEGDKLEIDFATAINSLHFAKIASAKDSFGNTITATLVEGDEFTYAVGEYTAKYTATDKAGQTVEKTVTYTVTSDIAMTVEAGVSVKYEQDSVIFELGLDGEKDVWLMANGGLVSISDYTVTEDGLELKSSYFRTLPAGENTLKLCSINGSTDFTFTVVDTGKPLFTFDSIYKTNIISGSPVVYKMPKTQIAGHEYSYTFKVTKDGVSYKAEQKGNNLVITTASGKNPGPGIYDISVTATNKADTGKKTTIKRDFRVYSNQTEIDGWKFGNDGNGSTMVTVDLSEEGYYRTAWDYKAKTPNSWNSRVFWANATKATFQTITFDFKVYSLGIADKENGPVKYVGKNGDATIPFSVAAMSGEGIAMVFYDQNGKIVDKNELKMNTWYTVKLDVSEIQHPKSEKTDIYWVNGQSNKWQVGMYIADMHFWTYEGSGTQNVFKDEAKTVSIERNGGKSNFASATLDDEKVMMYTVTDKHIPGTAIKRALKVSLADTSKEVVSIDFKYLEEVKDVSGNVLDLSMYVHDVELRNDGVFGANYAIVDAETGEPTVKMEVGKWYTLYITTHGRKTYTIYPMGKDDTQLTCKVAFKNLQTYDVDLPGALLLADSGNIAPSGFYKMADGEWGISYASYTGWDATPNTAYYRRIVAKLDSDQYSEVRFQFRYTVSGYKDMESSMLVNDLKFVASNITIVDDNFNPVPEKERQIGVWYTAVIASSDGSPLPKSFEMYPQGYNDGGKDEKIVNIELQFRNIVATENTPGEVLTNDDGTASLQALTNKAGLVEGLEGVDAEEGMLVYTTTKDQMPSGSDSRALMLKVLAEGKSMVKFDFKFEYATAPDGTPLNPDMLVAYEKDSYWRGARFAMADENGVPTANPEVGKWYTMYIITDGRSDFWVFPMGQIMEQQVQCRMLIKNVETLEEELPTNIFTASGATFAHNGLYKNAEGEWEYFYAAYNRYSEWIYSGVGQNTAYNRRAQLKLDSGDYVTASFQFMLAHARYKAAPTEDVTEPEWTDSYGLAAVDAILDADGNKVTGTLEPNVWYTAIFNGTDGGPLPTLREFYPAGYADGKEGAYVEVEMIVKNVRAAKGNTVHTNADNSISIQSAGMVDALTAEEGGIRYKMDKATAATTTMTDRAITVKRLEGNTKGLIKMELVLNSAKDQNDQDVSPWVVVENADGWNTYVLTDKDGNAVKYLKADGNSYFLYITTKDTKNDNNAFTFYPVGRDGEQVYADMLIKSVEAIEVDTPVASFTVPDGQSYMNVGVYADENGQHISMQSYQQLYAKNTSWRRRVAMTLDSDQYLSLSFQIRYLESAYDGTTMHSFSASGFTVNYYDANFNAVAEKDLQDGVWYNAILTKNDGSALPATGYTFYTVTQADGDGEYNAGKYVELAFQLRNFKGTTAEDIGVFESEDGTVTFQSAGAKEVLEKNEQTGAIRYQVVAEKMPYSTMDTALKVTLNDTAKQVISVKFTVNTLTDASGAPATPWFRVVTSSGNEANFAVIDENGDLVKNIEAGKTYTLFITSPEFATNLYNKPSAPTEFIVYPVGMDSAAIADMAITEVKSHTVSGFSSNEGDVPHTTTMVHNNISYYQVGENWNVSYSAFTSLYRGGTTAVVTNCTASARAFTMTLPGENIEALNLRMRFVEGSINGAENYTVSASGANLNDHTVTFYMDGAVVAAADRKAGEWYDVIITKSGGYVRNTLTFYFQGFADGTDANPVDVMVQMADVQILGPDTNPVVVQYDNSGYNPNQVINSRSIVDGKNVYTYTTRGTSYPTNDPWARRLNISFPAGQTHIAIEFRYTEAFKADGVTPITDIGLGVYNGTSGVGSPKIYDASGTLVASGNAKSGLAVDQWYTLIVEPGNYTSFALWTCHGYTADAAVITMEIRDRSTYVSNGIAPSTVETFARPSLIWTEADGWHYYIADNGNTTTAWNRRTQITLPEDGMIQLTYEAKINSVSGNATQRIRVSSGKNEYYDLETGELLSSSESTFYLEIGKWYKIVHTSNNQQNMGTSGYTFCYPGDSGAEGNISVSFRNFEAKAGAEVTVTFNLNGAEGTAPTSITVPSGSAYGELPTVEREGYTFGGWYTDAACSGTAVTATATVSASHTLYAKWEIIPDTNAIKIGSVVTDGTISCDIVDGEYVYTYTTAGKTTHGGNPKRKVNIAYPEDCNYVAVEFRFTESKTAAGADLAPYLRVYDPGNSGNGGSVIETIWIYDAAGRLVAKNNTETGLTVGDWYTLVVKVKSGTNINMCALSHYATDVPLVTMQIRERSYYSHVQEAAVFSTPWDVFPEPAICYKDGEWFYGIHGSANTSMTQEHKQFAVTLTDGAAIEVSFEVMMTNATGSAIAHFWNSSGKVTIYDAEGNPVSGGALQDGVWYTWVYANGGAALGTETVTLGYMGSSTGGIDAFIRNVKVVTPVVTFATPGTFADPTTTVGPNGIEYSIIGTDKVSSAERKLTATLINGNATSLSFEIKLSNLDSANAKIDSFGSGLTVKFYDISSNDEVTSLTADTWYKMVVTKTDGSALGTDSLTLGNLGGTGRGTGKLDVAIRNAVVTVP